jgi:hypothetical protein
LGYIEKGKLDNERIWKIQKKIVKKNRENTEEKLVE